jgi:hypothetical protein
MQEIAFPADYPSLELCPETNSPPGTSLPPMTSHPARADIRPRRLQCRLKERTRRSVDRRRPAGFQCRNRGARQTGGTVDRCRRALF